MEDNTKLEEFGKNNGFCGAFKVSAKTNLNIDESMEFLIKNIIQRMEELINKGNEVFITERKSISLDIEKDEEISKEKKQKDDKLIQNSCSFQIMKTLKPLVTALNVKSICVINV